VDDIHMKQLTGCTEPLNYPATPASDHPSVSRLSAGPEYADTSTTPLLDSMVNRVAATNVTVLIWGESGVGKERVARLLHERSPRREEPLVKVNCAALPMELLESELFGYERGAFTGAHREKPGRFEQAHKGTILLDEIGEMPLPLQAKILCVLQDGELSRLGGRRDIRVDVRVAALTNRDLLKLVELGQFREDLYYRLNVVSLHVPPLRQRREEISNLVEHFLTKYSAQYRQPRPSISPDTMRRFMEHRWPGNIRELENMVKRIIALGTEDWVAVELASRDAVTTRATDPLHSMREMSHPMADTDGSGGPDVTTVAADEIGLKEIGRRAASEAERLALKRTLDRVHWRRREAAKRLKISYTAILYKMKQYGLRG
jgi:two-component system, NtrC family, response regulator AtoC